VKDNADRMSLPRTKAAYTMPQIDAMGSALSSYRSMMNREAYGIALAQRHHFRSRLHPRTLFGQPSRRENGNYWPLTRASAPSRFLALSPANLFSRSITGT
jgi:hypothetical protein